MDSTKLRIIEYAKSKYSENKTQFEARCGLAQATLSREGELSLKNFTKVILACPDADIPYLLGIEGRPVQPGSSVKMIPLLPFSAVGGFLSDNNGSSFADTGYTIQFPDFSDRGADCAIRVEGDSMCPRYRNGDILAIRILHDPSFFQWGRCYVLNTTQGCVVKRLFPDPANGDNIVCRSEDREHYPDYTISKTDVIGVAIVVGHAGIE